MCASSTFCRQSEETEMMKEFAVQGIADVTASIPTASVNQAAASDSSAPNPAAKKKRSLPGNPDPKAEVIALSPKSLMATNKFVCEVCGKGFQRDQNLQLHRRGHNLPWKLKQRQSNEVVRKKVYICPERSCAHHDPSRALGDLTGIKKHFFRKHGEKRWSCDKCSKKYAVLSDWKAHSKICGTKEYRCDCGTIFSRRDSFITHRAFCDALAGEYSSRKINANPLMFSDQNQLHLPQPTSLQNLEVIGSSTTIDINNGIYGFRPEIPQWLASAPTSLISQQIEQSMYSSNLEHVVKPSPDPSPTFSSLFQQTSKPSSQFSATALLQKAAEMGATMSRPIISEHHGLFTSHQEMQGGDAFGVLRAISASSPLVQNNMVMGSFPSSSGFGGSFEEAMGGMVAPKREEGNGSDGMTRDFLGLRAPSHKEIFSMAGIEYCMGSSSSFEQPRRI